MLRGVLRFFLSVTASILLASVVVMALVLQKIWTALQDKSFSEPFGEWVELDEARCHSVD
jgi:hypothetical protein